MKFKLADLCDYAREKITIEEVDERNYISTENLLPNKNGVTVASSVPNVKYAKSFKVGDVLVSNIRPYFRKIWYATFEGGCSNDVLVFRSKSTVRSRFLYYVLADDKFFDYATATSKGTKMPRGDIKAIMEYSVPDIPHDAQIKIADLLSVLDDKIERNIAINKNLEEQALTLFRKWFVHFEFNGECSYQKSVFGSIPSNFNVVKVGSIPALVTDYVSNGSFASLKENVTLYQEPNYAYFIRNTDLKSGLFGVYVDQHSYDFLSKSSLFGGELIISNVGDVGSVFLCPTLDRPMTLGNNVIMIRPEERGFRYYLYIWFKYLQGQTIIQGIKGGSAQPKFNKTDFKNTPLLLPPAMLLHTFDKVVSPMFEVISENHAQNHRLANLRELLLPRLMSGELDVSNIEL